MATCQSLFYTEHRKFGIDNYLCELSKKIYQYVIKNYVDIIKQILADKQEEIIKFHELKIKDIRKATANNLIKFEKIKLIKLDESTIKIIKRGK